MKILFLHSGDRVPSARFRILPYVPILRAAGHACTVLGSFPQKYDYFPWLGFRPSQWLKRMVRRWHLFRAQLGRFDVIVLERELFDDPTWDLEARFRRLAPTMILDVDDAVFLRYAEKFEKIACMCDHILAGNALLAKKAARYCQKVTVVPTVVDPAEYPPMMDLRTPPLVIGWVGTTANVAYLLDIIPALQQLAQEQSFLLRIVTSPDARLCTENFGGVDVQFVNWTPETATREICRFDVGIMPLPDNEWTRYKCGFKLVQYMAAGIPAVASPVGVNAEMIRVGETGFLASTHAEWHQALARLLKDSALRKQMGQRGREILLEHYTLETTVPQILSVISNSSKGLTS